MPDAAKKVFFHLMWKIFISQKVQKNTPAYKKKFILFMIQALEG